MQDANITFRYHHNPFHFCIVSSALFVAFDFLRQNANERHFEIPGTSIGLSLGISSLLQ